MNPADTGLPPLLACRDLSCSRPEWNLGQPSFVGGVSASFRAGEFVGFSGPDGCGKGLLLNLLGLLERPDSGSVVFGDHPLDGCSQQEIRETRNRNYGFVFGQRALLPAFTVAENVAMPLFRICGDDPPQARDRTLEVLEFCGIAAHSGKLADRISQDSQDLVALARALVHNPKVLVSIRPKGSAALLPVARRAASEFGICVLWAGIEEDIAPYADRILRLREGQLE